MRSLASRLLALEGGPRRKCEVCSIERELAAAHGQRPPVERPCPHKPGLLFVDVLRTFPPAGPVEVDAPAADLSTFGASQPEHAPTEEHDAEH